MHAKIIIAILIHIILCLTSRNNFSSANYECGKLARNQREREEKMKMPCSIYSCFLWCRYGRLHVAPLSHSLTLYRRGVYM
jgi:hypothetical protein